MRWLLSVLTALILMGLAGCDWLTGVGDEYVGVVQLGPTDQEAATSPGSLPAASTLGADTADDPRVVPPHVAVAVLEAPDTVDAGRHFDIVVRTFGNSGCWKAAGGTVSYGQQEATVIPTDRYRETLCTAALVRPIHTFRIRFEEPGAALLRIEGRKLVITDDSSWFDDSHARATVEKTIIVR
jgi:hypothetical protein